MIDFILLSLPVFGVVALGWLAMHLELTTAEALGALSLFSFRFALPALVFRLISSQPLGNSFNPLFYGGYLLSGGLVFSAVLGIGHFVGRQPLATASARASTATVSNLGFLGPPLMIAFFGERGAGPLAMAILAEVMVLLSVGGVIMGMSSGRGVGLVRLLLRGTILNPVVAAIALGAVVAALHIAVPSSLAHLLAFLGGAAGPTALFSLGGTLALQRIDRATVFAAGGISAAKLLLYPLLVWYVLGELLHVGLFWVQSGALIATFPSAGSNYLMAQRYAADAESVSAAIVLSTILSVGVVPLAAWLVLQN
ncbi:MAG: hypothetical protein GC186_08195 [Rhodobacteraceae bacterium]|nr:hypothetical protein [Paracoccaceae bacterium]